jgi:hypothetical protein
VDASLAEPVLERGADLNWAGYDDLKRLDTSRRSNAGRLAEVARRSRRQIATEVTSR